MNSRVGKTKHITTMRQLHLYGVPEVASILSISKSLVRSYIAAGMLQTTLLRHPSGAGYINRTLVSEEATRGLCKRKQAGILPDKRGRDAGKAVFEHSTVQVFGYVLNLLPTIAESC